MPFPDIEMPPSHAGKPYLWMREVPIITAMAMVDLGRRVNSEVELARVAWPTEVTHARLVRNTPSVLVLEGEAPGRRPEIGTTVDVELRLSGGPRVLPARLASFAPDGRFLLTLGKRPVRGAMRVRVDLPAQLEEDGRTSKVRVVDLSSSGARVRGAQPAVGSECELRFVPPGRQERATLHCVVVRHVDADEAAVAFCSGALSFRIDLVGPQH
jgi:hypothetical protein